MPVQPDSVFFRSYTLNQLGQNTNYKGEVRFNFNILFFSKAVLHFSSPWLFYHSYDYMPTFVAF